MDYHNVAAAQPELGTWETVKAAASQVTHQSVVKFDKVIPIFLFIFMAPIIGMIISIIITLIIVHLYKRSNPHKADQSFKKLQLASSALFSLGHGLNDAQKVMGIIGAALIYYHVEMLHDPIYLNLESADVLIILHSIISGFLWFRLSRSL
jgi:PiT family inorganic phosphate transporter